MKKNQPKSNRGGKRQGSGRKKGSVAVISKKDIVEAMNRDKKYYTDKLKSWLDSDDSRLQMFAWEQIFGKATQGLNFENPLEVNVIPILGGKSVK